MCVIAFVDKVRLTDEQVRQMYDQNSKGGGVAYRTTNNAGESVVRWKKGLDLKEMSQMNRELPFPYVLHFRVPSHGTSHSPLACHPFGVDADAAFGFEGETNGFVLFHNGLWVDWKTKIQQIAMNGYVRIPSGPWSDSRGLAWAAHHLGFGLLELIDEKVIAFGPNVGDEEVFGTWAHLAVKDAAGEDHVTLVSNKTWERTVTVTDRRHHHGTQTASTPSTLELAARSIRVDDKPAVGTPGGVSQPTTFPSGVTSLRDRVEGGHHHSQSVQEAKEAALEGPLQGDAEGTEARRIDALIADAIEDWAEVVHTANQGWRDGKRCVDCRKITEKGITNLGRFLCYQCWAPGRRIRPSKATSSTTIGMCEVCNTNKAGSRRFDNDQWICRACWEVNGSPRVYYFHQKTAIEAERGDVARRAMLATNIELGMN